MINKDSRYADLPVRSQVNGDGTELRYIRPAILPHYEDVPVATNHRVKDSERIDILAGRYFSQASGWWLIAAASPRMHPDSVLDEPGDPLVIPAIGAADIGPK